jgi:hypothetical protein
MISIFNVLAAWTRDAAFMKSQPGYMDAAASRYRQQHNLHELRAVGKRGAFKTAFENPEFRRHITDYPPSAVSRPHLFRKVSVPGIRVSG